MEPVTDPELVRQLAEQHEEEDWRFRSFLKNTEMSPEEVDAIVRRHYETVRQQVDCTRCGNCCREVTPLLRQPDVVRLASALGRPPDAVVETYLEPGEEQGAFVLKETPCPFLVAGRCTVYDSRPGDCRSYPHLHKEGFVFRLTGVVENCAVCPIVYNVFERLKEELWHEALGWEDDWVC